MRLVMMGTGLFAVPTFEAILAAAGHEVVGLFTQPDRAVGAERGSTRQVGKSLKEIAIERNIPVHQPESINTPEGVALLRALRPDLCVVAAYGQILSNDVIAVAPHGCVNVHASLLPKYRGAAPIAWAIYHGETQTGVTIFRISKGVDTGLMLAQEPTPIGPDETAGDVEARLSVIGARLAVAVVNQIAAGTAHGTAQDNALATKAPKLKKEHGAIDWTRPADAVCNQIRAMHPWPTAYTYWHRPGTPSLRLIVHKAVARPGTVAPGEIQVGGSGLVVGTGAGVVEVVELQPAGKKRMTASEFLNGRKPQSGDRLGPEGA
jgi:methionyl-tRNA formyltransferase